MTLLLMKRGFFGNAAIMADQVLEIDPDNFKAYLRQTESYIQIDELAKAEKSLEWCKEIASSREEKLEVEWLEKWYKLKEKKESKIAKQAISKELY